MEQRGESHAIVEKKIAELKAGLQQFHKTKIDLINNRWWEEKPKDDPFSSQLFFFIISLHQAGATDAEARTGGGGDGRDGADR